MTSREGYTAGWLDSSIHDLLADLPRVFPGMAVTLMTSIDSGRDVADLVGRSPLLRRIRPLAKRLGTGIIVPTRNLVALELTHPALFGFDEVWFFREAPRSPKPDSVNLVGPYKVREEDLAGIAGWMSENGCSLGLGDGSGVNFVIKAKGLAQHLLSHTGRESLARA